MRLAMQRLWLTGQVLPAGARVVAQHVFRSEEKIASGKLSTPFRCLATLRCGASASPARALKPESENRGRQRRR